jgi:hypothetical protein
MEAQSHINRASSVWVHRPGLASLLLGSAALVTASIPYLRVLSLPLSGLGMVLSAVAMISTSGSRIPKNSGEDITTTESGMRNPECGTEEKNSPGISLFHILHSTFRILSQPLVGGAVSLSVFLLSGFWLGQFNMLFGGLRKDPAREQKTVPIRSLANRPEASPGQTDWVDASRDAVQFGDVRVRLVSATIGPAELKVPKGKKPPKEKYLIVKVRVSNAGAERLVQFRSWNGPAAPGEKMAPVLQDDQGRNYPLKVFPPDFEVVGRVPQANLPPGKKVEDVLIFEGRPAQVEFLRLELPASAFGSSGAVRMHIPASLIHSR